MFLESLLQASDDHHPLPLHFLITSRPDGAIGGIFQRFYRLCRKLSLHDILPQVNRNDIFRYLSVSLHKLKTSGKFHLRHVQNWPSADDVRQLAGLVHGSFIYATAAVRFIEDINECDPESQLKQLISSVSPFDPFQQIFDTLYVQALNTAFPSISDTLSFWLKSVLGSLVLLQTPLSVEAFEDLLDIPKPILHNCLSRLHSVIIIPHRDDPLFTGDDTVHLRTANYIRFTHPTFAAFISSPARCTNTKFLVDRVEQHGFLMGCCLRKLAESTEFSGESGSFVPSVPSSISYAAQQWDKHMQEADPSHGSLLDSLLKAFQGRRAGAWVRFCFDHEWPKQRHNIIERVTGIRDRIVVSTLISARNGNQLY